MKNTSQRVKELMIEQNLNTNDLLLCLSIEMIYLEAQKDQIISDIEKLNKKGE